MLRLTAAGHDVAVLNRGRTPDELPDRVTRLRADRGDAAGMRTALAGSTWDAVVDLTTYTGGEARTAADLLTGRVGHYVFISTGQVYLVRAGAPRPAREEDYAGPLIAEPTAGTRDHANWVYGVEKRAAEDTFAEAWSAHGFPVTSLRLPMVNSPRDHYGRLHGYLLRFLDGAPLLVPSEPGHDLRHVHGPDVVRVVEQVLSTGGGRGRAYNLAHDETVSLEQFLDLVAAAAGVPVPRMVRVPRATLEARGLFPACSPFSDPWMSAIGNDRSKAELGARYTPYAEAIAALVEWYLETSPPPPAGYERRADEYRTIVDQRMPDED